jgi:cell division protein FtsL
MDARLAEEQIFNRKKTPLIYLVNRDGDTGIEKVVHSRSGLFYVLVVIMVFFSLGLLLNIGLKIQSLNLERKILDAGEMIAIENERTDRISLKISELKSPSRIVELAGSKLDMQISDSISILKVDKGTSIAGPELAEMKNAEESAAVMGLPEEEAAYDSFMGTIYNIKDIVMVVSEGVLTFFIP